MSHNPAQSCSNNIPSCLEVKREYYQNSSVLDCVTHLLCVEWYVKPYTLTPTLFTLVCCHSLWLSCGDSVLFRYHKTWTRATLGTALYRQRQWFDAWSVWQLVSWWTFVQYFIICYSNTYVQGKYFISMVTWMCISILSVDVNPLRAEVSTGYTLPSRSNEDF